MNSLFDVIAHEDANDQGKLRQASALAHQRVEDRFGTFVRKGSIEDQGARYSLVEDDITAVVSDACWQVGTNNEVYVSVLASIKRNFISEPEARKVSSTIHEARKPRMCPYHSEVTDISLAQGEAQAGFNAMAQHAWTSQHCQGADYKGDRCKFKPAMTTQAYWDERAEKAETRRQERAERLEQEQAQQVTELPVEAPEETPEEVPEPVVEVAEIHEHQEPSAIGEGVEESVEVPMAMAASTKTAASCGRCGEDGVKKGQECPNCGYTGGGEEDPVWGGSKASKTATPVTNLGGPSPRMDKSKWTPKSVPELDADDDDGRWPTKREDVTQPIELDQGTRFEPSKLTEIGSQVTERQDVTEKGGPAKTDQGGTFGGGERSAVSSLLEPDRVREALSKFKRD